MRFDSAAAAKPKPALWLAGLSANPALAAAIVLAVAGLLGQAAFWVALRREASARYS